MYSPPSPPTITVSSLLARSLLLLLVTGFLRGFGQDAPLSDEDDVASAELLLQLPDESGLNLLVGFELGNGDEDDDGFLAAADVHLLRGRHVQLAQLRLKAIDKKGNRVITRAGR